MLAAADEARRHAAGELRLREHAPEVPEAIDVSRIRARTGLSQTAFAMRIGVSSATLKNWEQGHRKPTGPALVLLAMLKANPRVVEETLSARR